MTGVVEVSARLAARPSAVFPYFTDLPRLATRVAGGDPGPDPHSGT